MQDIVRLVISKNDFIDSTLLFLVQLPIKERLEVLHKFCFKCGSLTVHCECKGE